MTRKCVTNAVFCLVAAAALLNLELQAATDASGTQSGYVNLDQLIVQMLQNNPELQAARKRWDAMQKRPGQERALPDPEVRLGWSSMGAPLPGFGLGSEPNANLGIEISQTFPYPGKRSLRSSAAVQEAKAESFVFRGTELNLLSRLKSSFYELQFLYDAIAVLQRNRILLENLAKVAENRYSVGDATQQDLIKSQVEISVLDTRLVDYERRKQSAVSEINMLLNREINSEMGPPEPPGTLPVLPPLEDILKSAMNGSPMLRAQKASIDGRQFSLDLARREYYPDFEVMGGYFYQGSMKDMWEFRVKVNVPIFFAHKQRLGIEEAGARLSEAQKTYQARERMIDYQIKDLYLSAENARRLMDLYSKRIIPQASLALESSVTSYGAGKIDFLSVLSNVSTILENEMSFYESRTQFMKSLTNLHELMGQE